VSFAESAARLAGLAGILFNWTPDTFWNATPAELTGLVAAIAGDAAADPPEAGLVAQMMEAFPDG
jgi:uncharacterized phage protein (TIGR02216 family)